MQPRYSVETTNREGVPVFTLREFSRAFAEVVPALGANVFAFQTTLPVIERVVFSEFLKKPTSYGIPVLFPFPNRLKGGAFTFQGVRYAVNPARHGFVRDKAWRAIDSGASDAEGAWIRSEIRASDYESEILTQFPFPFILTLTHRLREGGLQIHASARNTGVTDMPVGFGLHPYFRLPENGAAQVNASKRWELEDSLPTGALVETSERYDLREPRDLATLFLDDIYTDIVPDRMGRARCHLDDAVNRLRTTIEFPVREFPHVVVYTPPPPRRAICIEPNSCPTDAFNLQQRGIAAGVIALRPGEAAEFNVRISCEPWEE